MVFISELHKVLAYLIVFIILFLYNFYKYIFIILKCILPEECGFPLDLTFRATDAFLFCSSGSVWTGNPDKYYHIKT